MDIRIEDLSYLYGDFKALEKISLLIKKGSFTAVLGRNGSGKTTLLRNITGLIRPSSGAVFIGEDKTTELSVKSLAGKTGFLFQNPDDQIFSKTVYEEVSFGPSNLGFNREKIESLVKSTLKLTGLENMEGENPLTLSSEKRRLLALSSVLALDTPIIIMDEPFCGLGSDGKKILNSVIENLREKGKTLIMITHDMNYALANLKNSILLKDGKLLFHGDTTELFSDFKMCEDAGLEIPQIVKLCKALELPLASDSYGFVENLYLKRAKYEER